ncbi:MAG: histidine phosphatase family protein, partial [Clostridia bacterium]|nr:histidine phosphatase family protein [Clostridia bacterium]
MAKGIIELELFLVRHAESMGNAGLTDSLDDDHKSDPPLTEQGLQQAQLLGKYFAEYPLDYLFASGMRRALQTAEAVRAQQPDDGAKQIEVHKIFTECNTGTDCAGKTISEIQTVHPFAVCALDTDASERIIFHGADDTDEQLLCRGKEAIRYLRKRFHNGEKVMVAAHAAYNTFMLYAALGLSHEQAFDPSFFNTGVTKIVFFKEG